MERTEWPSSAKVRELRESGEVPYSKTVVRGFVLVFLAGVGLFCEGEFEAFATSIRALWSSDSRMLGSVAAWRELWVASSLSLFFWIPLAAALLSAFFGGLAQTRFFFSIEALAPRLERLWLYRSPSGAAKTTRTIISLVTVLLGFGLAGLGGGLALKYGLPLTHVVSNDIDSWWRTVWSLTMWVLVLVGSILVVVTWFGEWVRFMWKNRMTRAERDLDE